MFESLGFEERHILNDAVNLASLVYARKIFNYLQASNEPNMAATLALVVSILTREHYATEQDYTNLKMIHERLLNELRISVELLSIDDDLAFNLSAYEGARNSLRKVISK